VTPCLAVQAPGLATTLQDFGRFGHQALGIPVSGALDADALRLANRLVGNAEGEAALEIRMMGPTLCVCSDAVLVVLAGTGGALEVLAPSTRQVPAWQSVRLERDAVFRVPALRDSATAYLAVAGGFDVPEVLGSRSTYGRGAFGGFQGRALAAGDHLPLRLPNIADGREMRLGRQPDLAPPARIRVVLGPQQDYFSPAGLNTFLAETFAVTNEADRMGLRLAGPRLEHAKGYDIVSDAVATGAIQVPGNGQPIVLLADHQTTGGYPKIATVISADLPALGRMRPGDTLRFEAISVDAAEAARRAHERNIADLMRSLEPVRVDAASLSSTALLSKNLISGLVDAMAEPA
jgi:biotin-dependent carboxylase-like uncharacterized protein